MKSSEILELIKNKRGKHEFIPTGFSKLDQILDGGFLKKELAIIGADKGTGKSFLAIHLAMRAVEAGFKSAYFSLEISNELIIARMLGMKSRLKASHIMYGMVDEGDREYLKAQADIIGYGDLFNAEDDTYDLSEISKSIIENKYEFAVIDFIQNVQTQAPSERERLTKISLELQRLAKSSNSSLVIVSQLSNEVGRIKDGKRPLEFMGSGGIAQVADLGFFLTKADNELLPSDIYNFLLSKNRRGASSQLTQLKVEWPGGIFNEI